MAKRKEPTPKKRHLQLAVIPEPETGSRSVLIYTGAGTVVISGPGNVEMECGSCGVVLVRGVKTTQTQGLVLKCPNCGAFNETLVN